jgi:HK97 family phage major capsid protein
MPTGYRDPGLEDLQHERERLHERRERLKAELTEIHRSAGDADLTAGQAERFDNLSRGVERVDGELRELDERITERVAWGEMLFDRLRSGVGIEHGADEADPRGIDRDRYRGAYGASGDDGAPPHIARARSEALRVIERRSDVLSSEAGDRLDRVLRLGDRSGLTARYIEAVANPAYLSAFGKMAVDPLQGHLRFSPQEVEAVRRVSHVEAERAMSLTGSAGGFAVPFELDPTILLSGSGALNPIRPIARVESIGVDEWRGVSSAGVTASFQAEAVEAADNSPTLAQPTVSTEKANAFVPFSIEIGQDWGSLQSELGRLFADAKDVLESDKFLTGTGTAEPTGVLTGLTTTQRVQTAGAGAFAIADVYSLINALPARFLANATFASHPARYNTIYRFVGGGSTEPPVLPTREGPIVGYDKVEWTSFVTTTTTGSKIAVFGDFRNFLIADRIGLSVELIPHLVGTNHRPTGQRGLYAYWRVGSGVLVQNAFRYLEVL